MAKSKEISPSTKDTHHPSEMDHHKPKRDSAITATAGKEQGMTSKGRRRTHLNSLRALLCTLYQTTPSLSFNHRIQTTTQHHRTRPRSYPTSLQCPRTKSHPTQTRSSVDWRDTAGNQAFQRHLLGQWGHRYTKTSPTDSEPDSTPQTTAAHPSLTYALQTHRRSETDF